MIFRRLYGGAACQGETVTDRSAISLFTVTDAMHCDRVLGLIKQHPVIADAKAEQPLRVATERL